MLSRTEVMGVLSALAAAPAAISAQDLPTRIARPTAVIERSRPVLISRNVPAGPAVTGLRAEPTAVSIRLIWACPEGATGYEVFATPKGGAQTKLPATPTGSLCLKPLVKNDPRLPASNPPAATGSYTHADLTIGAEFTYVVRALYPGGYADSEALIAQTAATTAAPVITSLDQPPLNIAYARNGDTVVVQGHGLDGLTGVVFQEAFYYGGGFRAGTRVYDPPGYYLPGGPPIAVTPIRVKSTSLTFVAQLPVPLLYNQSKNYRVIVTKGQMADTSNGIIQIAPTLPVQKITGVKEAVVRSGALIEVNGMGLENVEGGYFGSGTLGSNTNPYISIAGRTSTRVYLQTKPDCNQEGILMLKQPPIPGVSSDGLITGNGIRVGCASGTPTGYIAGTESSANNQVSALPGETILIKGTNLRWVTRVLDQRNASLPFTFSAGFQAVPDRLTVTLPQVTAPGAGAFGFHLENSLTNPVVDGTVTGMVVLAVAPTWYRISPTWAEAGQKVTINGHHLKNGAAPTVTVGGVPAQILSSSDLVVEFKVGAGTSAGPIEIQNSGGKTPLTGPFTAGTGANHPGFFVVSGPSSVTEIVAPRPALAYGDTLLVRGQNLARLSGVCVTSSGQGGAAPGTITLRRLPLGSGLGYETSNTEMQIFLDRPPVSIASGPVQLNAPTTPPGDYAPSQFACAPNPGGLQWP